jgi:hypothetical protein
VYGTHERVRSNHWICTCPVVRVLPQEPPSEVRAHVSAPRAPHSHSDVARLHKFAASASPRRACALSCCCIDLRLIPRSCSARRPAAVPLALLTHTAPLLPASARAQARTGLSHRTPRHVRLPQFQLSAVALPCPAATSDETSDPGSPAPDKLDNGGAGPSRFARLFELLRSDVEDDEDDTPPDERPVTPFPPAHPSILLPPARGSTWHAHHASVSSARTGAEVAEERPSCLVRQLPADLAALARGLEDAVAPPRTGVRGALSTIGAHAHLPLTPTLRLGLLRGSGASAKPSPHVAGDDQLRFTQYIDEHSRASSILEPSALRHAHVPASLAGTMYGPPAAECVR